MEKPIRVIGVESHRLDKLYNKVKVESCPYDNICKRDNCKLLRYSLYRGSSACHLYYVNLDEEI